MPVFFWCFFPMISQTPGGCMPNLNQLRGCLGFECFFFFLTLRWLCSSVRFLLWGKHVALFDPIDPEPRCFTWCNQALVHCDDPPQITHVLLDDEKYQQFKGHWTDLLFYRISWWCSQGLTNHNPAIWRGLKYKFSGELDLSQHRNTPQIPSIQVTGALWQLGRGSAGRKQDVWPLNSGGIIAICPESYHLSFITFSYIFA